MIKVPSPGSLAADSQLKVARLATLRGIVTEPKTPLDQRALAGLTLATDAAVVAYQEQRVPGRANGTRQSTASGFGTSKPARMTKLRRQVATRRKNHSKGVATKSKVGTLARDFGLPNNIGQITFFRHVAHRTESEYR